MRYFLWRIWYVIYQMTKVWPEVRKDGYTFLFWLKEAWKNR